MAIYTDTKFRGRHNGYIYDLVIGEDDMFLIDEDGEGFPVKQDRFDDNVLIMCGYIDRKFDKVEEGETV